MHIIKHIENRDEFVAYFKQLGEALKLRKTRAESEGQPWVISMGKDFGSGKSLAALCVDSIFTPERYPPDGTIPQTMDADFTLIQRNNKVFFRNVFLQTMPMAARGIEQAKQQFQNAEVLMLSNMELGYRDQFRNATHGLCSDLIDMNIAFHDTSGVYDPDNLIFKRSIEITVENSELIEAMAKVGMIERPQYLPVQENDPLMQRYRQLANYFHEAPQGHYGIQREFRLMEEFNTLKNTIGPQKIETHDLSHTERVAILCTARKPKNGAAMP